TRYREVFEKPGDPIEGHTYAFLRGLSHCDRAARLLSPGKASVLGLAVVERLQPSNEAHTSLGLRTPYARNVIPVARDRKECGRRRRWGARGDLSRALRRPSSRAPRYDRSRPGRARTASSSAGTSRC